ncbi:PhnA-like protein [Methylobacterium sp. WL119]|uniref:PhnA-like protein n=2 Tax=Methylobacterium TaxID=407 RepID=UPI0011CB130F|nr:MULTISPECIES: PhnA-like protein [unclassified Methylobacterium]TXN40121.1 PhnA-like protein [Methylobacterium sp. WL93]TXN49377.1 PhnA-like protein [Methylobacterium sp. WL119]
MALSPDTTRSTLDHDFPTASLATPAEDMRTMALHSVSWGAVIAGAVIALVAQIILNMVGLGIGLSTIDPAGTGTPTAGSLSSGAGIWFVISGILAATAGGWLAGRLSGKPANTTTAYHGLLAWAVSTLVVVYLLSSAVGGIVSGASSAVSSTLGGAGNLVGGSVKTAAQAAAPSLQGMNNPFSNIEGQIRGTTGNDPEALKNAAVSAMRAAVTGDAAQQKDAQEKAAQALAKAQGIPVDQARTQVTQYVKQFNDTVAQTKEQAKQAADATARVGSQGALYGALALVLGALSAFFAGRGAAVDPVLTRTAPVVTTQRRV